MTWNLNVHLESDGIQIVPMQIEHLDDLVAAASDNDIWQIPYAGIPDPSKMKEAIEERLKKKKDGVMMPFSVFDTSSGRVVGMTTYCHIEERHRRVNIGYTWYAKKYWRTGLNTVCKLLLLQHAFEALDCIAVGFRVDVLNKRSQRAVERLGARREGTIRNYCILPNGLTRDMHFYSILPHEWPYVKEHLIYLTKENPYQGLDLR